MIRGLFAILVILVSLSACVFETGESKEVKGTVMRYNQLLVEGYRNLNMNPLQEVALRERAEKAYLHMAALGEAGVRMESTLKKIRFIDITIQQENKATVKTKEVWDFRHINIVTKQIVLEERDFEYIIIYELIKVIKERGRWLVADVIAAEGGNPGHASQPQGRFSSVLRANHPK